jgi:hypothetical protein
LFFFFIVLIIFCLASLKTVFVDKPENVLMLLKLIEQVSTLKRIVLTKKLPDEKENEIRKKAKDVGIEIMTYNQLRVKFQKEIFVSFN